MYIFLAAFTGSIRCDTFTETNINKILGLSLVSEKSVAFNDLARMIAREDFINVSIYGICVG
jgi:hypothetical protein